MLPNILQISFILSVSSIILAKRPNQVIASFANGCQNQINTSPFENVGNSLYYFGQEKLSWYNAFLTCRSLGGFLASIEDPSKMDLLSNHLIQNYPLDRWWWLSGSDLQAEGKFFWYGTGDAIDYADWSAGQPDNAGGNENCVHIWYIKPKFQMNDWMCNQAAYYICEAEKPITVAVTLF